MRRRSAISAHIVEWRRRRHSRTEGFKWVFRRWWRKNRRWVYLRMVDQKNMSQFCDKSSYIFFLRSKIKAPVLNTAWEAFCGVFTTRLPVISFLTTIFARRKMWKTIIRSQVGHITTMIEEHSPQTHIRTVRTNNQGPSHMYRNNGNDKFRRRFSRPFVSVYTLFTEQVTNKKKFMKSAFWELVHDRLLPNYLCTVRVLNGFFHINLCSACSFPPRRLSRIHDEGKGKKQARWVKQNVFSQEVQ